ncbi:MepB family protein [Elizabethkingia sp. JS20170427COW]|uniref:MepB family protein n=1 Tax=Elizabethkingia sp. JS20170427COW TaxID=2583851 RepID=UPI001110D55F|nr:MepB family protein [Elizabethkingia sp. JS20170427COW]QCX52283.1 hypothetical protein FGE20_00230 [Elizabethkingia sp. JS20170427COW]
MNEELKKLESFVLNNTGRCISDVVQDKECEEYFGFNMKIDAWEVKFRKAKITPKKVGQFVTLWKRNSKNQTEPFEEKDQFNFYIVVAEEENNYGFFLFPRKVLVEKQILTTCQKIGKRGFRVYPEWAEIQSKQAQKTQSWQVNYFINLDDEKESMKKLETIIQGETLIVQKQ